jgi:hypothetical protein
MKTKKCSGLLCKGKQQNIKLFSLCSREKDGLQKTCKICHKHYRKINASKINKQRKKYRQKNNEKIKKAKKEYAIKNKDKIREYKKLYQNLNGKKIYKKNEKYRLANKKHTSKYMKKYRDEHKDKIAQQKKEWAINNPEQVKVLGLKSQRKRRARKLAVQENYTSEQEQITRKAFYNKCFNCKSTDNLCIDHHRPLSKGHPLTLQNAVVLCQSCNSSKSDKNPEDFYGEKKCDRLDKKLKKIASSNL